MEMPQDQDVSPPAGLPRVATEQDEFRRISDHIAALDTGGATLRVLEAGCGRKWCVDMRGRAHHLTGIDLDAAAMSARQKEKGDLDEAIVGDLLEVELPDGSFDIVYSSFVLEHVEKADLALEKFVRWLRPGGLLVLRVPDPDSVYGFMARRTPHRFHVWVYRRLFGVERAGEPGVPPYPVHYHPVVSRDGMEAFRRAHGLEALDVFADGWYRPGRPALQPWIHLGKWLVSLLSLGRLKAGHTNLTFVLRKTPPIQVVVPGGSRI